MKKTLTYRCPECRQEATAAFDPQGISPAKCDRAACPVFLVKNPHDLFDYCPICEFHGFEEEQKRFKSFMHHIGLKYDKYR